MNDKLKNKELGKGIEALIKTYSSNSKDSISNIAYSPQNFTLGDDVWITAEVADATFAKLVYRFGKNERFKSVELFEPNFFINKYE